MAEPVVIWQDGDEWRDLVPDVRAAGAVTTVSRRGTARYVDVTLGRQVRVPHPDGHMMGHDRMWVPLGYWELTPCGLVLEHADHWARGSPLRLVLAGLVWDWPSSAAGVAVWDAVRAGREPVAPGHPDQACGAAYCPLGEIEAWRAIRLAQLTEQGSDGAGPGPSSAGRLL